MANFVNLMDIIYPVGSIYMSTNNISPASFIGGTWAQIQDAVLAASGNSYSGAVNGYHGNKAMTVIRCLVILIFLQDMEGLSLMLNVGNMFSML